MKTVYLTFFSVFIWAACCCFETDLKIVNLSSNSKNMDLCHCLQTGRHQREAGSSLPLETTAFTKEFHLHPGSVGVSPTGENKPSLSTVTR